MDHPNISNGWFRETETLWKGQQMSLEVKEILFVQDSKYQNVLVFQSCSYGNVLVLDGVIQATERDEFAYQEMITHLPMNSHPNPKNILVIGGGDGGVLREVVKHDIDQVTLVEIDEVVVKVAKKFLPAMAAGFAHPKVNLVIGDGFEYLSNNKASYDVIITDSSGKPCFDIDPVGPAEALFTSSFYDLMRQSLLPGGIICTQGECIWLHLDLIKKVVQESKKIYKSVGYATCSIPTYPSGSIGFVLCSNAENDFSIPKRQFSLEVERSKMRYYNSQIHRSAFVLPQFARQVLE